MQIESLQFAFCLQRMLCSLIEKVYGGARLSLCAARLCSRCYSIMFKIIIITGLSRQPTHTQITKSPLLTTCGAKGSHALAVAGSCLISETLPYHSSIGFTGRPTLLIGRCRLAANSWQFPSLSALQQDSQQVCDEHGL